MDRFVDLKFYSIGVILIIYGCGNIKPAIELASYPEVDQLLTNQMQLLNASQLHKEVWLDGVSESKRLPMDSTGWAKELTFLKEINPNQPGYIGAFEESRDGNEFILRLKEGEKGSLRYFSQIIQNSNSIAISATIHEDKNVYLHHKEILVYLKNGNITEYLIEGYQKIILKDTIRFKIKGVVVN